MINTALEVEMSEHLGYDRHDRAGRNGDNSRNGRRTKTVLTELGPVPVGGHALAGKLTAARLAEAVDDFASLHIERYLMTASLARMLALRENLTVYDAAYVVLAKALQAPLVAADEKLAEARRLGVEVRVLRVGE